MCRCSNLRAKKQPAQMAGRKSVEESPVLRARQVYEISCGGSIGECPDRPSQRDSCLSIIFSSLRRPPFERPPESHPTCGRWRPCCRPSCGVVPPGRYARLGFGGRAPDAPGGVGKTSIRVAWQTSWVRVESERQDSALASRWLTSRLNQTAKKFGADLRQRFTEQQAGSDRRPSPPGETHRDPGQRGSVRNRGFQRSVRRDVPCAGSV